MILEQHSSPESLWRWKIHHKTHKKLKEQSRYCFCVCTVVIVHTRGQQVQDDTVTASLLY